jgi:hypothetical protein
VENVEFSVEGEKGVEATNVPNPVEIQFKLKLCRRP